MKKLISFFEIPATDFGRAVKFYESILNTKLSVFECESEKMAFFPGEENELTGAISYADGFTPSANGVLIHFQVENMSETLVLIEANGGGIVRPKTKIECDGKGYFAMFTDSEGNTIGLNSDN